MILSNITVFVKDNKTNILLAFLCILLIWLIINWFQYLQKNYFIFQGTNIVEGFNPNIYVPDDKDSMPKTDTVNLPINTNYTCSNFCGPKATCSKSGQQCSTDVDCYNVGCKSLLNVSKTGENLPTKNNAGPEPLDDALIFSANVSSNADIIDENATIKRGYTGVPVWEDEYNAMVKINNDHLAYEYAANPDKYKYTPHYKTTETATGLFYDIGPTALNEMVL
jgi:hypothetical protein